MNIFQSYGRVLSGIFHSTPYREAYFGTPVGLGCGSSHQGNTDAAGPAGHSVGAHDIDDGGQGDVLHGAGLAHHHHVVVIGPEHPELFTEDQSTVTRGTHRRTAGRARAPVIHAEVRSPEPRGRRAIVLFTLALTSVRFVFSIPPTWVPRGLSIWLTFIPLHPHFIIQHQDTGARR